MKGERLQIKVAFDRDFAERVLPKLKELYGKPSYAALFQLGLSMLAMHAEVHDRGHDLVEIDKNGKFLGILRIPELASARLRSE